MSKAVELEPIRLCITPGCKNIALGGTYTVLHCPKCNDKDLARIGIHIRAEGLKDNPEFQATPQVVVPSTESVMSFILGSSKCPPVWSQWRWRWRWPDRKEIK